MRQIGLALVSFLFLTPFALAQDIPSDAKHANAGAVATGMTTSDTSSVTQVGSVFSIEGSTADKKASGQIGFQFNEFIATLGAEAPLGSSQTSATLANLNGLVNKTTGKAAIMWQYWDIPIEEWTAALDRVCSVLGQTGDDCTYLHLKRLANSPAATELVKKSFDELRHLDKGTVYFAGANAQVAPEEFDYLSKTDLSPGKVNHTSWSVSGYSGVLLESAWMISGSYKRQVIYTANDQRQVCTPIGTINALQCVDKIVGPPGDPTRSNQTAVEVRKFFGQYFAISPKLTRDWSTKMTGVEAPLYFFRDKAGGLNGGVTLGYVFEKKSFTASAFIGQVLGLVAQ